MKSRYFFALCLCLGVLSACGRSGSSSNAPTLKTDDMDARQQQEQQSTACLNNPALCNDSYSTASSWGLNAEPYDPSRTQYGSQYGTTVNNFGGNGSNNQFNNNGYSDNTNYGNQSYFGNDGYGYGAGYAPGYGGGIYGGSVGCDCGIGRQLVLVDGALMCAYTQGFQSNTQVATIGVNISHRNGETDTRWDASFNQIIASDSYTDLIPPMNPNACVVAAQVACNPVVPNPCAAVPTPCDCGPVAGRPGNWCIPGGPTPYY